MTKVKVAINGYGTIGKRVADAVNLQNDMEIIGVAKTRPNFEAKIAHEKGYAIYTLKDRIDSFNKAGMKTMGTVEEMVKNADVVIDCTPGGVGVEYKKLYEKEGVKAIWQGGEKHAIAGTSFNATANYDESFGKDFVRVVSCNTTGLCRIIYPLDKEFGIKKTRVTLLRRSADPADIESGPINAIVLDPVKLPSHHGPDLNTVMPNINIITTAVKLSTTLMHLHTINIELKTECSAKEAENLLKKQSRLIFVGSGIKSTAEVMEFARDLGRPRGDMWENCIWNDSISIDKGELYLFQAIHQESIVVPENIDAIRAVMELEKDNSKSIAKTNKAMGIN